LLAATIAHVEDLKARGVKYLPVDREVLLQLGRTAEPPARPVAGRTRQMERPAAVERSSPVAPIEKAAPAIAAPEVPNDLLVDRSVVLSPEQKEVEMARIRERALACVKCPNLASSRRNVVFGVGTIHTGLMFVGEAPGVDEDEQGEPFVGKAGQLLTKIIQAMGLDRDRVYIANVLKCRPDTPGQRYGNRKPTLDEMNTCEPYLLAQNSVIRPKVIVALGATAVEGLLGRTVGIMKLRGNWQDFNGTPLMPTYHPAFLLRNQSNATKRLVWEDMLAVMEKLAMPISEKQRGFFLGK
jgi:DNA polymerase